MNKIVLIEDDPTLRENTLQFLQEEGFEAYAAQDGSIGLTVTREVKPDLVLCDVGLPKMDGYETCIAIRKERGIKDVPVIFLTAYSDNEHVVKGFEAGGQDYLVKPFNYRELLARVNAQLKLKFKKDMVNELNEQLEVKVAERTKELEDALQMLKKANAELLKSDEMKTEFLHMISHELRTPLNGIMGPIQLLKQKVENKNLAELLDLLDHSATRLEEFAYSALEITRIKSGRHIFKQTPESPENIIEYAVLKSPKNISDKSIRIKYKLDGGITINCDREMLVKSVVYILGIVGSYGKFGETLNITSYEAPDNIYLNFDIASQTNQVQIPVEGDFNFYLAKLIIEAHKGTLHITGSNQDRVLIVLSLPSGRTN